MDVDNTSPCPCGAPGTFLRVTLLALDGSDATVRVDALIHGGTSVRIGDTLRATWNGELPCSGRAEALSIGGSALAVYAPSSACDASDCTDDDASRATLQMTAWTDDVLMARTATARVTVPADELGRLWSDPLECRERFGDWSTLPGAFDGSTP